MHECLLKNIKLKDNDARFSNFGHRKASQSECAGMHFYTAQSNNTPLGSC